MLKFLLKNNNEVFATLANPIAFSMNMDEDIPADDISVSFVGCKDVSNAENIDVYNDDALIFTGIIDEIQRFAGKSEVVTRIVARSLAAALLDNESKPVSYSELSTSVLFMNHIRPYGIEKYIGEERTLFGSLNISKGTTNWQVAQNFCVQVYGSMPRVEPDGRICLNGLQNEKSVLFSVDNGIKYNSIKENTKPCKMITKVYSKLTEDGDYSAVTENPSATGNVRRERYIDASNPYVPLTLAESVIKNSARNSYVITLRCFGRLTDLLGAKAEIHDKVLGELKDLYVSSLFYSLSSYGEYTTVTLKRREENVDT